MHIFNTNKERETLITAIKKERVQIRSIPEDNAYSRKNYYCNEFYDIKNKIYGDKKNLIIKNEYESINNFKLKKNESKNNTKKINKKSKILLIDKKEMGGKEHNNCVKNHIFKLKSSKKRNSIPFSSIYP